MYDFREEEREKKREKKRVERKKEKKKKKRSVFSCLVWYSRWPQLEPDW